MSNIIIYVSSRNNYDMLSGEVLKNIDTEGFEFINVDDKSSPEEIEKGKKICQENDIVFLENESRGVQYATNTLIRFIKKNRPDCKWVFCFQHDCYPISEGFFDRISKIKIIKHQQENSLIYINDFINFDLVWNIGIGFGLLSSDSNLIYNSITLVICMVIFFLVYLIIQSKLIDKILFSLILGGALGNFYDRLTYKAVPDFIDIHYDKFHWFTFNIADIFISLSIVLLIIKDLFLRNEKN